MLSELMTWWIRQMTDLLTMLLQRLGLKSIGAAVPDAVLLTPGSAGTRVERRRKGRIELLAAEADAAALQSLLAGRRRDRLVLLLPSRLLVCETTLPVAAQTGLDRVLRYEMDRLTPFAADDVLFDHRVLGVDRAQATLRVELAFVPRVWVQPVLDRLKACGAVPVALEAAGPDGVVRRLPIGRQDPGRRVRERWLWRLSLATCGALAAACIIVPALRQSLALAEADDRIAVLRPEVAQVEALRRRMALESAGTGRIATARQQAETILEILGVLTDTLPDDTWLTSLTLRQRTLVMEGHSTAATKLIAGMAADSRLHDPAFAAPVLRDETGSEVFTIRAGYGP
jgi:general secretion pathway protein L